MVADCVIDGWSGRLRPLKIFLILLVGTGVAVSLMTTPAAAEGPEGMAGSGTEADPFIITNATQLQAMEQDFTAHYVLGNDIDASPSGDLGGNFEAIAWAFNDEFSGSLDGRGHEITDLVIEQSGDTDIGLIGETSSTAVISNVTLTNASIRGNQRVGGIVGSNGGGTISNSSTNGTVRGDWVGGVVGQNSMGGEVSHTYSTMKVTADSTSPGGVVGNSDPDASVTDSYWDESVSGQTSSSGSPDSNGLTTSEMTGVAAETNMVGLDFDSTWTATTGYPALQLAVDPESFDVSIDGTNTPVNESETLEVSVTVTNTGGSIGRQTVNLTDLNGNVRDSVEVTLLKDESNSSITLNWTTQAGDSGTGTVTVNSEDDTATASVTIQAPANFSVTIDDTNAPVVEGEDLLVNTTVENTGDIQGTQDIALAINDTQEATQSVTIEGDSTTAVNFTYATTDGDSPTLALNASSENSSDTTTASVQTPANFSVAIDGTNSPVTEGETLSVDVSITNIGGATATKTVNLSDIDGVEQDSVPVTLAGEASNDSITQNWTTTTGDAGTGSVTVASPDDTETSQVEVLTPGNFSVEITDTNSPVAGGQALTATVNVTNLGGATATQSVNLTDFDDAEQDSASVTLDGGQSNESVTLTWATTTAHNGSDTITVSSPNASDTATVTINDETTPTADAGADQTIDEDTETWFNGTATDAVGVTRYWWDFGDGNASTGQNVTHSYADPGSYTVTMNASDDAGNNGTDTLSVSVNDTTSPTAVAGSNRTVNEGTTVSFDGSDSTDNVGVIAYNWTFGDGTNATGSTPSHTFDDPGTYTVTLNVSDAAGHYANDSLVLSVNAVSSGGGGGGGGGSAGSDQRITVESLTPADDGTSTQRNRVAIENAQANTRIAIDVNGDESPTANGDDSEGTGENTGPDNAGPSDDGSQSARTADDVVMDRIEMTVNREGEYDLEVQTRAVELPSITDEPGDDSAATTVDLSTDVLSETDRQFVSETGSRPSGYVRVDHVFPNSDVSDVTFQFQVRKSHLSATDVDPGAVQLYRDESDGWRALSTQQVGETDEYYQFAADSPGLSLFTIGAASPIFEIEDASTTPVNETVNVGDAATVAVMVRNVGNADGQFTGVVTANGDHVDRGSVSVPVGASRTIELGGVLQQAGTTDLAVNGHVIGSVEILQTGAPDDGDGDREQEMPGTVSESGDDTSSWMIVILGIGLVVSVGVANTVRRQWKQ